jgi:GxxExxY protein
MMEYKHSDITEQIIKAFYKVYNTLGYGFLEKVYERAMLVELHEMGLKAANQVPVDVWYAGIKVGFYLADLVVEDVVICELKSGESLAAAHEVQLTNYLKATSIEVGLLLGFCKEPQIKRRAFDNSYKAALQSQS